jgi:hypothetical protein
MRILVFLIELLNPGNDARAMMFNEGIRLLLSEQDEIPHSQRAHY